MKKIVLALATVALVSLSACKQQPPTTENAANAMEANLSAQQAALDNEVNADTNAAAANAMNEASATYNNSVDSVRAEAVKNSH